MEENNDTANRELRTVRIIRASPRLVWEAWSNPEHITNWWGPNGFTSTIHEMDFQENGEWNLTLHGPDGTNYPNRSIFREIIPLEKIVLEHFNPHFISTVDFDSVDGKTLLEWTMVFDTKEMHDIVVKAHHANQGQQENLEKLENYLSNTI